MPITDQYLQVDFGTTFSGLAVPTGVGFEFFDVDGVSLGARSVAGVSEIRAGSGIYHIKVASLADAAASIVWDTGVIAGSIPATEDLGPYHLRDSTAAAVALLPTAAQIDTTLSASHGAASWEGLGVVSAGYLEVDIGREIALDTELAADPAFEVGLPEDPTLDTELPEDPALDVELPMNPTLEVDLADE
jgi:hypothetical protein